MRLSPDLKPLFESILLNQNWLTQNDLILLSQQTSSGVPLEDILLRHNKLTESQIQQIFQEVERQAWELQTQRVQISNITETPAFVTNSLPTAPEPERFGLYEVIERLAQGGMGIVYKVRHQETKQIYALKAILSGEGASQETIERFHREVKANAKLQHPCIVQLMDSGKESGLHYFCMEYVEGSTLEQAIRQGISVSDRVRILKDTLEALHYAHNQGIIHRDLKPANIFITATQQPKIGDFGLAKDLQKVGESQHLTRAGEIIGTPAYMAPEQIKGKQGRADERSDIYSMGACLYQTLTQRPPFDCGSIHELLYHILAEEPTPPSQWNSTVSKDLDAIVLKALHKEKEKRYQSAQEFAHDLDRFLQGIPVLASIQRKPRFWHRKIPSPLQTLFLGIMSVLFLAGLAILFYQGKQSQAEKKKLTQQVENLQKEKERLTEMNKRYEQEFFYRLSQGIGAPLIESLENTKNDFLQQDQGGLNIQNWIGWVQNLADPNDPHQKNFLEELCQILEQASASQEFPLLLPEVEEAEQIRPFLEQAEQKTQQGDWQGAIEAYNQSLGQMDDSKLKGPSENQPQTTTVAEIYRRRGMAQFAFGNLQEAVSDCDKSIEQLKERVVLTTPSSGVVSVLSLPLELRQHQIILARVYHYRGGVRYKMNDFFGAIQDYSEALKFHPQYAPLLKSIQILGNIGNSQRNGLLKNMATSLWKQLPVLPWPQKK